MIIIWLQGFLEKLILSNNFQCYLQWMGKTIFKNLEDWSIAVLIQVSWLEKTLAPNPIDRLLPIFRTKFQGRVHSLKTTWNIEKLSIKKINHFYLLVSDLTFLWLLDYLRILSNNVVQLLQLRWTSPSQRNSLRIPTKITIVSAKSWILGF